MLLAFLCVFWAEALAHSASIQASVTLDPTTPAAGWHVVRVELRDFYGTAISRAGLTIEIEEHERERVQRADLVENVTGTYQGLLEFGDSGKALLRVEAILPDGLWLGLTSVRVGSAAREVRNLGISLRHRDTSAITPLGWVLIIAFGGAMVLSAVMAAGLLLDRARSRGRA